MGRITKQPLPRHISNFDKRELSMQFILLDGGQTFDDGKSDTLDLSGLRCRAQIEASAGDLALGQLYLQIFGMKMADMLKMKTDGYRPFSNGRALITLSAGSIDKGMTQIFKGTVMSGHIEINQPEASLIITASPAWEAALTNNPPNSYKGEVDIASVIESLTKQIGFAFKNNGVTKKVRDLYLSGSVLGQIKTLAESTQTICLVENETVTIWNNGGTTYDVTIELSPETGLIGYPSFNRSSILVKSMFNPNITVNSRINVQSDFADASGIMYAFNVIHELATLEDNAPWFTTVQGQRDTLLLKQN